MPCDSRYMDDGGREERLKQTRDLGEYVRQMIGMPEQVFRDALLRQAGDDDDRVVALLCSLIGAMTPAELDLIVYNARDRRSRDLATWWEEHQTADRARERAERARAQRDKLRQSALAKMTPEERAAFGRRIF